MYHIQPFYIGGNRYDIPILYVQFLRRNIQTCFRNIRNRNIFPFFSISIIWDIMEGLFSTDDNCQNVWT